MYRNKLFSILFLFLVLTSCQTLKITKSIPNTIVWKESIMGTGIDGVYNPTTKKIEWKESIMGTDIAGVWHPTQQKVIWKEPIMGTGIAGVYCPE